MSAIVLWTGLLHKNKNEKNKKLEGPQAHSQGIEHDLYQNLVSLQDFGDSSQNLVTCDHHIVTPL